jgi:hypothetical protein
VWRYCFGAGGGSGTDVSTRVFGLSASVSACLACRFAMRAFSASRRSVSLRGVRFSTDFGRPGPRISSVAALSLACQRATSSRFAAMHAKTTANVTFTRLKTRKVPRRTDCVASSLMLTTCRMFVPSSKSFSSPSTGLQIKRQLHSHLTPCKLTVCSF